MAVEVGLTNGSGVKKRAATKAMETDELKILYVDSVVGRGV